MIIDNHNIDELLKLQNQITERINRLQIDATDATTRKNNVKHKTMLNQLTSNDRILGIGLTDNQVYLIDYCDVRSYNDHNIKYPEWHAVSFGHKTKPFGISTSIHKDSSNKAYCLFVRNSLSYFFTLSPKTWQPDLKEALLHHMKKEIESIQLTKKSIEFAYKDKLSRKQIDEFIQHNI